MSAAVCFLTVRRRSRERRWAGRGVGRRKTMQKHLLLVVKKQQQRARRKLLLRRPRNQEEEEKEDGRRRAIDRPLSSIPLLVALVLVVSDFLVLLALVFHLLLVESSSSSSLILSPCGPAGRPPPLLLNSTTKSGKTTTALIAVWILDSALLCCAVLCRSSFRRTPAITRDDGPSLLPSSWNAWIVSGSLVQLGGRRKEEEEVRPAMRRTKEDEGRPADGRMRTSSLSSSLVVLVLVLGTFSSVAVSSISPRFPTTADSLNPWLAADGGLILRAVAGPGNSSPLNWIRPNPGSCAPKPAIPPCPSDRYCRLPSNNNKTAIISSESSSSSLVCLPYLQQSVVVVVGEEDEEEEEQNPSSAECICGHPDGAKRIDALRKYHLQHCYHYSLWHVLSDTMREGIAISRQQCYAYVEAVQQLDNLAAHFVCQFEDIIRRYDCGQTFSSKSSCHQCKVFFSLFCSQSKLLPLLT